VCGLKLVDFPFVFPFFQDQPHGKKVCVCVCVCVCVYVRERENCSNGYWRQEEKGTTVDEMVEWNHQLKGHEFEQAPGVGEGQGSLVCCSPWGCKESEMTVRLN